MTAERLQAELIVATKSLSALKVRQLPLVKPWTWTVLSLLQFNVFQN
jgi:hypothetical protein